MERLRTTFIPGEDPDGSERRVVAGQRVVVYRPKQQQRKVAGLTFVVTAANIPLSKYASIIAALNSVDHVVVGYFVNVLNPPIGNHRAKAEGITNIFHELKGEFNVSRYDIVGHSIGGKIALLNAALYDGGNSTVRNIVALDPVDQSPVEFTKEPPTKLSNVDAPPANPFKESSDGASESEEARRKNLSLEESSADITLTFTGTGYFIGKRHNAREIQKNNPSAKLVLHRNSCHMVYCDEEGLLSWKALMGRGKSEDRNKVIKDETITLIKEKAMRSTTGARASGKAKSTVGKARQAVANGISDLKELGDDAKKKGNAMSAMSKIMG